MRVVPAVAICWTVRAGVTVDDICSDGDGEKLKMVEIAGIIHTWKGRKSCKRNENMQFGRWCPWSASSRPVLDSAATRFGIPSDICELPAGLWHWHFVRGFIQ